MAIFLITRLKKRFGTCGGDRCKRTNPPLIIYTKIIFNKFCKSKFELLKKDTR